MNIREMIDKLIAIEEAEEYAQSASAAADSSRPSKPNYSDNPAHASTYYKDAAASTEKAAYSADIKYGRSSSNNELNTRPEFGLAQLKQRPTTFTGTTGTDTPALRLQRGRREIGLAKQIVPGLDFKAGISRSQVGTRDSGAHVGISGPEWSAYARQPFKGDRPASLNVQYNKKF